MYFSFIRIALLQFVTVIASVLLTGFVLRVRFGSGFHHPLFATYVRDYGVLLLLFPFIWAVWGMVATNSPKPGLGDVGSVIQSGLVLLIALVAFGFFSFISACTHNSLIQVRPALSITDKPESDHP